MMGLTHQQQRLLAFIGDYQAQHGGIAPSYAEMKSAMGLHSKKGINRLIVGLEKRGAIRRIARKHRAIEIIEQSPKPADICCPNCGYQITTQEERK